MSPLRYVEIAIAGLLLLLLASVAVALLATPPGWLPGAQLLLVGGLALALVARSRLEARERSLREARDEGVARMLQRMSRSVSSEAIVQAIVDELRRTADADHLVVCRLRPAEGIVEVTVVSGNTSAPPARTVLPAHLLGVEGLRRRGRPSVGRRSDPERAVVDALAERVRTAYGLANVVAEPLIADGRVVGALMLSRRGDREWSLDDRRLLSWSAQELAAALARAHAFEEAERSAHIDALTGLPNRRYLEEMLAVLGPRRRAGDTIGVLMIDVDRFKALNDRYGHATGDVVLRAVAEQISLTIRADDTPARYGGEEFAVVLKRAKKPQAIEVAERIRRAIAAIPPADLGTREPVTVSVGVAVSESEQEADVFELLHQADAALYRAKRAGRDQVAAA